MPICQHCNDTFKFFDDEELNGSEKKYCPYCRVVVLSGEVEDPDWPPVVTRYEIEEMNRSIEI